LTLVPAFLVGAALLSSPSAARADLTITLSESGHASQSFTVPGGPPAINVISTVYGDFSIEADTATSFGSNANQAMLQVTTLSVRNSASGSKTLTVTVDQTGYTVPYAPTMLVNSSLSTTNIPTGGTISFVSSLNGGMTPSVSLSGPTVNNSIAAPPTLFSGVTRPYTLDSTTTITIGAGLTSNSTGTTTAFAVPEPSSMALAGLGAMGLIGYGVRRRKARTA
jgi:hypothetical protein